MYISVFLGIKLIFKEQEIKTSQGWGGGGYKHLYY